MNNSSRIGRATPAAVLLLALTACGTQYQSIGLAGGHQESAGPGHLERVDFYGNGYTEPGQTKVFALYRAAETAQAKKMSYFVMYDSLLSAAAHRPSEMPRVGTLGGKPWAYAYVLFLNEKVPGANNTAEVLKLYADAVKSPAAAQK